MAHGQILLEAIHRHPTEYLEQPSLRRLIAFDDGYAWACASAEVADPLLPIDQKFDQWMSEQLNFPRTNQAWWGKLLLMYSDHDAFHAAFDYFARYRPHHSFEASGLPFTKLTWESLLASIRKRPPMYLGKSSVTLARAFWDGYGHAARVHHPKDDPTPTLEHFSQWLSREWAGLERTYRWEKVLLFAHSDESDALKEFFLTFDQFCATESPNAPSHPVHGNADVAVAS
jgi:hypothetical protein